MTREREETWGWGENCIGDKSAQDQCELDLNKRGKELPFKDKR